MKTKNETKIGGEEIGSWRKVTFITPDNFSQPIKIISTTFRKGDKGETAIGNVIGINYFTVDIREIHWKVIKRHNTEQEAINFHTKQEVQ